MSAIQVQTGTRNSKSVTRIRIGEASGELPRHLMTGQKACGYIVQDNQVYQWEWLAVSESDGQRFIISDPIDLLPFTEITTSLRSEAMNLLRALAAAMQRVPLDFLNPTYGFIETWRIFFIRSGGVLLLPEQLSQIILLSVEDADRKKHHLWYLKSGTHAPFGLCHQFTQFLYEAAAGFAPYEPEPVRTDRWRHIPLSLGFTEVDERTAAWIDETLAMRVNEQQELASAAYSAQENLRWFLKETEELTWNLPEKPQPLETARVKCENLDTYLVKQEKRVRRNLFWRKRGAMVVALGGMMLILALIVGSITCRILQPPYTADLAPIDVVEEFFDARNDLDAQRMEEILARGTNNPYEREVSSLFVNSQVRKAYEGVESVIRADTWNDLGRPSVPPTSFIYGTDELVIEMLDERTFRATYTLYIPSSLVEKHGNMWLLIEQQHKVSDILLTDSRGFWEIESITDQASIPSESIRVKTTPGATIPMS